MAQTLLIVVLAAFISSGLALSLPDLTKRLEFYNFGESNRTVVVYPALVSTHGFAIAFSPEQIRCEVVMPDGSLYNLWPNSYVPVSNFDEDVNVHRCGIIFTNPTDTFDGTYRLRSLTRQSDGSLKVYRITYHLNFVPFQQGVQAVSNEINVISEEV